MFGRWTKKDKINMENADLVIKILGSGCKNCQKLEEEAKGAIEDLGLNAKVEHVKDFVEIAKYGVMNTPALVANEKVLSSGRVLNKEQIMDLLKEYK